MKDIRGNEFRVGAMFVWKNEDCEREILKITDDYIAYWNPTFEITNDVSIESLLKFAPRILHYKKLAPDKNGKMLCEGDTVNKSIYTGVILRGMAGKYFIVEYELGEFSWASQESITFVSRPTDIPKSEKNENLKLLIDEAKEAWHKLDEALKKAEEAGLCNSI